jgi:hypothetical protein
MLEFLHRNTRRLEDCQEKSKFSSLILKSTSQIPHLLKLVTNAPCPAELSTNLGTGLGLSNVGVCECSLFSHGEQRLTWNLIVKKKAGL